MFYIISFDVSDDKARYRVVKALKGYCVRVQKSVFECNGLTEHQFLRLKNSLESIIDETTDSVRYYRLCRRCLTEVEYSGLGTRPSTDDFEVV